MHGLLRRWDVPPPSKPELGLRDRILDAREVSGAKAIADFLDPKLKLLEDPKDLPGASEAAKLLAESIREGKKVLIFGDYDADGITASAVLYHIIKVATGQDGPSIYIPDRFDEGYGIQVAAIEKFANQGVDLVISVDCGITAIDAANRAKELGIQLIVTDHHKPIKDGTLPDCAAIVHPGLIEKPSTLFAGVGVAYQLAWAFARVWSGGQSVTQELSKELLALLPLAAIGTVADMVPLVGGNRIITRWGLQLLPSTEYPGLRAIMDELDTPTQKLNAAHISFHIAPLLNAAGRLSDASKAVHLLTHLEGIVAKEAASELTKVNKKRQKIQKAIIEDALEQIENQQLNEQPIIILRNDEWQRGVVGVAAGKCIESHYRPTILLSGDGDELVGSARSIKGFSIFDALCACDEHLLKFGGHDMAAGLTLKRRSFADFVAAMTDYAAENLQPDQLIQSVMPDVIAEIEEVTNTVAVEIEKMGPFGIANRAPVLQIMNVHLSDVKVMGGRGAHLSFKIGPQRIRCVWWNQGVCIEQLSNGTCANVIGKLKVNEFRGRRTAELDIIDIQLPGA